MRIAYEVMEFPLTRGPWCSVVRSIHGLARASSVPCRTLLTFAVDQRGGISLESRSTDHRRVCHGETTLKDRGSLPVSNGRHATTGIFGKSGKTEKGNPFCVA